jgi:hypothetical protein
MKSKIIRHLRVFGPFLVDRQFQKVAVDNTAIRATADELIYAETLTPESNTSLRFLASGQTDRRVTVFFTAKAPNVDNVMDGIENRVGWKDVKELHINKVFDVDDGIVTKHNSSLIKNSFPEVYEDLESTIASKK